MLRALFLVKIMNNQENNNQLKITLPKGRINDKVAEILKRIGISFSEKGRSYRPRCSDPMLTTKLLKSQNIPKLVELGRHDCGFCGYDWIVEQEADVVELLDLGFDPVRIVAAIPEANSLESYRKGNRKLVVASEYRRLTEEFIRKNDLDALFLRAFGATEALPPEDADIIVDNTSSGATLRANRLKIVDEILRSTTRFICNREALNDPIKRKKLMEMTMLLESTLQAKKRVLLEMNVDASKLDALVENIPSMRSPTISKLYKDDAYAVKIAVCQDEVPTLIPELVRMGARDILEYSVDKIVNASSKEEIELAVGKQTNGEKSTSFKTSKELVAP